MLPKTILLSSNAGDQMTATDPQCEVIHGVLAVNKEAGWTSHDVVAKIRQVLGGAKVGHAGTLDPAATGVLPVLLGKGTRIAEHLVHWDKEYRAQLRLGETTDTLDATGTMLEQHQTEHLSRRAIWEAVSKFRGEIQQMPPMYSAVKVDGVPLYRAARAGKTIARAARRVIIHELDILDVAGPDVTLRVVCSKGTYIRALCADIGTALAVGGHLRALERTRVGPLTLDRALTVNEVVQRHRLGELSAHLSSLDEVLCDFPALVVGRRAAERVSHGAPLGWSDVLSVNGQAQREAEMCVRLHDDGGRLLAVGRTRQGVDRITIEKVLATI